MLARRPVILFHPMHPLLDPDYRPVVGHRGNAAHAPENTLESFSQALALGADAIELDIHLSADGHVVVVHDPTLDRTTSASGPVAALPLARLREADAGARFTRDAGRTFPYAGRGLGIPTLDEVLGAFERAQVLIEVKTAAASAEARRIIERHGAEARVIVESFSAAAMIPFLGSRIAIGASQQDVTRLLGPALLRRRPRTLPFSVMCIPRWYRGIPVPVGALAACARPAGALVHVWTVNDPAEARRLWAAGARGIISDDPAAILAVR